MPVCFIASLRGMLRSCSAWGLLEHSEGRDSLTEEDYYLLPCTYYVSGIVLGTGDITVNKIDKIFIPCVWEGWREVENK